MGPLAHLVRAPARGLPLPTGRCPAARAGGGTGGEVCSRGCARSPGRPARASPLKVGLGVRLGLRGGRATIQPRRVLVCLHDPDGDRQRRCGMAGRATPPPPRTAAWGGAAG